MLPTISESDIASRRAANPGASCRAVHSGTVWLKPAEATSKRGVRLNLTVYTNNVELYAVLSQDTVYARGWNCFSMRHRVAKQASSHSFHVCDVLGDQPPLRFTVAREQEVKQWLAALRSVGVNSPEDSPRSGRASPRLSPRLVPAYTASPRSRRTRLTPMESVSEESEDEST